MDVFNYIEMFYNPKRQHCSNDGLSPLEYERQYLNEAKSLLVKQWLFSNKNISWSERGDR